jgi:hypothetical protein
VTQDLIGPVVWALGHGIDALTVLGMIGVSVVLFLREEPGSTVRGVLFAMATGLHVLQIATVVVLFELPVTLFSVLEEASLFDWIGASIVVFNIAMAGMSALKWVLLIGAVFMGRSAASGGHRG